MNPTTTAITASAQTAPNMKMTTDSPPKITTRESVETRLGTLKFFGGFPNEATVEKVYDNLDFQRGVQAFLKAVPGASQAGQLPPVNAFWSLTMYELPASLLVANPLNRYLLNSTMLSQFKKDADGGLNLYIQNESPARTRRSTGGLLRMAVLDRPAPLLAAGRSDRERRAQSIEGVK